MILVHVFVLMSVRRGAIKEYYRFPFIQYCPVWLYYCTSTLVSGLLFLHYEHICFCFSFGCYKSKLVANVWPCGSHSLEMHQSLSLGELRCLTLLERTGTLDCLTPDATSLFTTLWGCLVSSRDGWRDWDKRTKLIVVLLHCPTAAVGHYWLCALQLCRTFLLPIVHILSAWIILLLQNWWRQSVETPICKMIHEKWGETSYVHF